MKNFIVKSIVRVKDAEENEQIICHSSIMIIADSAEQAISDSKELNRRERRLNGWDPNAGTELIAEESGVQANTEAKAVKAPAAPRVKKQTAPKAKTKKAAKTDNKVSKSAAKVAKTSEKTDSKPAIKTKSK